MSEVRDRSWEDPMPKGRRLSGVTLSLRPGAGAERSYPMPEARGCGQHRGPPLRARDGVETSVEEVLRCGAARGV